MTRYCVSCQNLITMDETAVAFKTGFYKITIPLALCERCMAERNGLNGQDNPHAVDFQEDQIRMKPSHSEHESQNWLEDKYGTLRLC